MMKFLVLVAMLGYGGYKLHRKSERWLDALRPLLGSVEPGGGGDVPSGPGRGEPPAGARDAAALSPGGSSAARGPRRWIVLGPLYLLALVGLLTVGRWVTTAVADRGYDAAGDPAADAVARSAHELTYAMLDHPVQRLFIPGWRVVDVRREPGRCTEPLGPPELREYVADVRLYTFFALPYRTVAVTCGGAVW